LPIISQFKTVEASDNKNTLNKLALMFDFIDKMEPGDIIIHLPGNEDQYGHCRLFTGYNSLNNRYSFVDSYYHVLGYSRNKARVALLFLFITCHWKYDGVVIVRVNATAEQKQNAIDFANLQIGKRFEFNIGRSSKNYNPEDKTHRTADQFYCSELPWAAYYNCNNSFPKKAPEGGYIYGEGIDIDVNGWEKDNDNPIWGKFAFVHPLNIIMDDNVQIIDVWMRANKEFNYR